jgi:hypothetical protein
VLVIGTASAADVDEFRVKRSGPFEFAEKPAVTRDGDAVTIRFKAKAFCDATIAIENAEGRIIRHLACGVLGKNAPAPFQKNSFEQTVVWDGKDDQGAYVDDKDALTVRVSLGLKPRFERTLHWHPKKRVAYGRSPLIAPQPEGVYVYDGGGTEQVRLFDHDGSYVRTVYPFPRDKVRQVRGLGWVTWPPNDYVAPEYIGYWRSSFLTGGEGRTDTGWGTAATAFAVRGGRVVTLRRTLCRFAADGSSGGMALYGPRVAPPFEGKRHAYYPKSAAISPDGRRLYITGFYQNMEHRVYGRYGANINWHHGVYRMELAKDDLPTRFVGDAKMGKDATRFAMPTSVACDAAGRVYVADHLNDRVQVFSPDAKLLKSLPVKGPAIVQVHPKTGELYVFSWAMPARRIKTKPVQAVLRKFASWDSFKQTSAYPLPLHNYRPQSRGGRGDEVPYRAAVDFWSDPVKLWMVTGGSWRTPQELRNIDLYVEQGEKLRRIHSFGHAVKRAGVRQKPPILQRQRMYVDPRTGVLYVAEADAGVSKAFNQLLRIDPESGRQKTRQLPFGAEDMAIDLDGRAYLRTTEIIGRFDMNTWREVPFDYGEARTAKFDSSSRGHALISGLILPSQKPVYWHQSGMHVTARGDLIINCVNRKFSWRRRDGKASVNTGAKPYEPPLYPGRVRYAEIHIYDKRGKVKQRDVVQGVPDGHGTYLDARGGVYLLLGGTQIIGGKPFRALTGTVAKFQAGKGRLISDSGRVRIPLGEQNRPEGEPDLVVSRGRMWAVGAEWMYTGIGFVRPGGPCQCWNCRFDLDYFARSFAPETQRCQVAVLDTNGNLIVRVGKYGNVDDGIPQVTKGGPVAPRRVGGDEVALAYAAYVTTHTDRRLFIADAGNARIVSVKLGYHASEMVPLKDVVEEE